MRYVAGQPVWVHARLSPVDPTPRAWVRAVIQQPMPYGWLVDHQPPPPGSIWYMLELDDPNVTMIRHDPTTRGWAECEERIRPRDDHNDDDGLGNEGSNNTSSWYYSPWRPKQLNRQ